MFVVHMASISHAWLGVVALRHLQLLFPPPRPYCPETSPSSQWVQNNPPHKECDQILHRVRQRNVRNVSTSVMVHTHEHLDPFLGRAVGFVVPHSSQEQTSRAESALHLHLGSVESRVDTHCVRVSGSPCSIFKSRLWYTHLRALRERRASSPPFQW